MIGASLAVIYCVFALVILLLILRGAFKLMKDPKATEDDLWIGGLAIFGLSIIIGLHGMLMYALTVGILLK